MAWVDNDPPRSQRLLSKNPTARCKITFYKKFSVRETDSPSFRFIYIYTIRQLMGTSQFGLQNNGEHPPLLDNARNYYTGF